MPFLLLVCLLAGGCARARPPGLEVWAHTGRPEERRVLEASAARFGRNLRLTFLPDGTYNAQVQAAALAHALPDLLEFDGPFVYNYVWGGHLIPLEGLLPAPAQANLLPSLRHQGTYAGHLYAVGMYDSGLGLFARRSLVEAHARLPAAPAEAWTAAEFERLLGRLAGLDPDGRVLDLKLNYRGEWYTYGFAPALDSAGGGLDQGLDSPESRRAVTWLQRWSQRYTDANLDDQAFTEGRVALSWVGHWEYARYARRWGPDLALLPLPDFGHGSRTGGGSWNWGITRDCSDPRTAADFLAFLLEDEQVLAMTAANGAVPGTRSAAARSPLYADGGPLHLYLEQILEGRAVPRPVTPGYPVVTSVFQEAFEDILVGIPVGPTLKRAAALIAEDQAANRGYSAP